MEGEVGGQTDWGWSWYCARERILRASDLVEIKRQWIIKPRD